MNPRVHREPDRGATSGRGTLFVVATPIGNLEDITLRALRVLREVALVAAEDTRRTGNLLRHYDIPTRLISLHEHNERSRGDQLVRRLLEGDSIALVSDAGTPGISDPGAFVVKAARDAGLRVEPIPGPSAVSAILSASGLDFDRYAFAGFPPLKANARARWFDWVSSLADVPVVCFEAPHRIAATLADIHRILVNRPIIVARELTKLHEEWSIHAPTAAPDGSHAPSEDALDTAKGEFTLVIAPEITDSSAIGDVSDEAIRIMFGQITEIGLAGSRRDAIRTVAARFGIQAKAVFDALERVKKVPQT